jgi:hypothetical protein
MVSRKDISFIDIVAFAVELKKSTDPIGVPWQANIFTTLVSGRL